MISRGQHRARSWGRLGTTVVAAAASAAGLVIAFGAPNASAAADIPPNSACEARGVQLLGGVLAHANPQVTPCAADNATLVHLNPTNLGLVNVSTGVVRSRTIVSDLFSHGVFTGQKFRASADLANLRIYVGPLQVGTPLVFADVIRAQSQATNHVHAAGIHKCKATGTAYIANLLVAGLPVNTSGAGTVIPLVLGLSLHLNEQTTGPDGSVTETALSLVLGTGPTAQTLLAIAQTTAGGGCTTDAP
jgi:hypothetical protein